ncbi:MAG: class I SAM-dependent methyltransferase [Vicinamibacterales bacterium]
MGESRTFAEYARYYDLLYFDKDYAREAQYVDQLLQRFKPNARTIIELGSGTGRHAWHLAKRGYQVHGIERSPGMLASAERLVLQEHSKCVGPEVPRFSLGDIRTARLPGIYDAAVSLFHVISYQTTNDDLVNAFNTARAHLIEDGVFLFDVWYGPAVLTDRPTVRVKRMANEAVELVRTAEPTMHPNVCVVEVNYQLLVRDLRSGDTSNSRETHAMRYLFWPEIELLATMSAFHVEHAEEWLTGAPLGENTWGACFVLRANRLPNQPKS